MQGSRFCSAISCARRCFLTVIGKYVPPLTVASFAMIRHSRCCTRPMPVTRPAHGASSSYIPFAASGESSRNGVFGSSSAAIRSRTGNFPCCLWRSMYFGPPPSRASAILRCSSAMSDCIRSRLARKSPLDVSRCVSSGSISACNRLTDGVDGSGSARAGQENLPDTHGFQVGDVLLRNDAAREDSDVGGALLFQQPHDFGKEHVVRAGENRETDGVDIFLDRCRNRDSRPSARR